MRFQGWLNQETNQLLSCILQTSLIFEIYGFLYNGSIYGNLYNTQYYQPSKMADNIYVKQIFQKFAHRERDIIFINERTRFRYGWR